MSSLAVFFEQVIKSASILLDDVVVLAKPAISRIGDAAGVAKMAAASAVDDTMPLAKTALKKASAVVVDDTAVSSDQLNGASIEQHREYAVWRKIVVASLVNKVVIQTVIMGTGAVAPIIPHLMLACGAGYLAFEGAHKMMEYAHHLRNAFRTLCGLEPLDGHQKVQTPATSEADKKASFKIPAVIDRFLGQNPKERAVLTDLILLDAILSTEILLVANGSLGEVGALMQAMALAIVGAGTTLGVYGVVLMIVRADNVAGYFANPSNRFFLPGLAKGMMRLLPYLLQVIGVIGTTAMLGVAGDVISHLVPSAVEHSLGDQAGHAIHAFFSAFPQALSFMPIGAQLLGSMALGFIGGLIIMACGAGIQAINQRLRFDV